MKKNKKKIAKTDWQKGTPILPGLYWFDPGLGDLFTNGIGPFIIQVTPNGIHLEGEHGGGALRHFQTPALAKIAAYAHIEQPKKFKKLNKLSDYKDHEMAWVKSPKGYIGLGWLRQSAHEIIGSVVWLNNPKCGSESGWGFKPSDNIEFCPVKKPTCRKKNEIR